MNKERLINFLECQDQIVVYIIYNIHKDLNPTIPAAFDVEVTDVMIYETHDPKKEEYYSCKAKIIVTRLDNNISMNDLIRFLCSKKDYITAPTWVIEWNRVEVEFYYRQSL